jgi:uncharacterized protein YfeS
MSSFVSVTFLASLLLFSCAGGPTKDKVVSEQNSTPSMERFEFSLKTAHPNAQALMAEEFYWSPVEDTAPFGSDSGFDAAYGFREWRLRNKNSSPVTYLNELVQRWQFPFFDYNEMDTLKIQEYISTGTPLDEATIQQYIQIMKEGNKKSPDPRTKELDDKQLRDIIISTLSQMGGTYLVSQDNAIIGIGFAQFVLEGKIDSDMKEVTTKAITRQLLPILINQYGKEYREFRKEHLTQMLEVIKKLVKGLPPPTGNKRNQTLTIEPVIQLV